MVIMLNNYYKMFDDSMSKYQVYKVNCVNDSHMIVSGLPPSDGDHHVTNIAGLALNIQANINKFVVSHRPYERLKLRAGINTGPIIAGVQSVGIKMPRFRIFGDTVRIASLLNATGEATKIHVSMETKILLDSCGSYFLEPRGLIVFPGADQQETFWLLGKENGGYEPDDKMDLSELRSHKMPNYF